MTNVKAKRRTRQSPFDFVVPLQVEECAYRCQHLPSTLPVKITLTTNTQPMEFRAVYYEEKQPVIDAVGKVQRWEGTSTRFKGSATTIGYGEPLILWACTTVILFPIICGGMIATLRILPDDVAGIGLCSLIPLYIAICVLIDQWGIRRHRNKLIHAIQAVFAEGK
jgi:hypothetical protein